ncbi:MAG TPA: phosphoribosylglycinamide formyltransferase [Nitrospirales bacterium]|nr:phosphoribosylglycinamide formyltransferase [Nitrospirales bacterium]
MSLALGVLISGRGSNLMAILDAIEFGQLDATVKVVVSNKANAAGLDRAKERGIPTEHLDPKPFAQASNPREAYDSAMGALLQRYGVECVALAGYMRIVTPALIQMFPWKIINIHPSLLPAFPGLDAQRQALEWGTKVSGCTVHLVTEGVDEGPIIVQAAVPILEEDTVESLSARILDQEHRLYPQAIQLIAHNRLMREGRKVRILSQADTGGTRKS